MLSLQDVTLSRGNKILLKNASVSIYERQKIGLIGHNGCGKSSLFQLLLGKLAPDAGSYQINSQLRISYLSQQTPDTNARALDYVLEGDEDYSTLIKRLEVAEKNSNDEEIVLCHDLLKQIDGYSKPAKACAIMAGLGFNHEEQLAPVNSFSGGWCMRLSLARCLMKPADMLLLDEPTNHLDLEAIVWLEKWLKQLAISIILISHDRDFLDAITSHIIHVENQSLTLYTGNYSGFEMLRAQKLCLQQASFEKQQVKINHLMRYVNRFRASAVKAKQAQSRLKAIEKMEVIAQAHIDSPFSFAFYPCPKAGKPLIKCEDLSAGYEKCEPFLKKINLSLNPGDRIALLGPNGEGKSTLIKTLTGSLAPLFGTLFHNQHVKIGYYAQHQLDDLNEALSPLETIQELSPEVREQVIRDFLGGFNFVAEMATSSIKNFSGGEKARLALAKLVWLKPNLLFLDEPTNHLDLGMRSAIEIALQSYEGALILISHDRHLLQASVNEFYLVFDKKVEPFKGDLDDYYQWLLRKNAPKENKETQANTSYREKKSVQNRMKKLEQLLTEYQKDLNILEEELSKEEIYTEAKKDKLSKLLKERETLKGKMDLAEDEWMDALLEVENG